MGKRNIAIVVQRYGEDVNGGAELHARWLAEHLLEIGDVTVLTTCAIDYYTWKSHYPAGTSTLNGVTVERFPVDKERDWEKATVASRKIALEESTPAQQLDWIREQGPYSTCLLYTSDAADE